MENYREIVRLFLRLCNLPKLKDTDVIHHIDLNRENNNINNLMIFNSQAEHKAFHNKINQFGMTNPIKRQIENRWKNL